MASGSSAPDDLLRSGARSGLKRELASILRSQPDSTLSRTRSGSNPNPLITVEDVPTTAVMASGSSAPDDLLRNPLITVDDVPTTAVMATGFSAPDDLLCSGARSGLKRELARILRSQSDSTLSRTRSGSNPNPLITVDDVPTTVVMANGSSAPDDLLRSGTRSGLKQERARSGLKRELARILRSRPDSTLSRTRSGSNPNPLITVDNVPTTAVMVSGSSAPDDLLRSGARSGLKRELARILRSQPDSTLSRTRSGSNPIPLITVDDVPTTAVMASGSSAPDDLLRSGARSGLKRELAGILRSQPDSTLSRTRSGSKPNPLITVDDVPTAAEIASGSSAPDELLRSGSGARSGLKRELARILSQPDSLRAKKLPLAADQSLIHPILSSAAAVNSIQNETHPANLDMHATNLDANLDMHATNLDRYQTTTGGKTLLATPGRRFTRSALVQRPSIAGEGDPVTSKTNVGEQATTVLEIPGDGSNMQTSVFTPDPSKSGKKQRVKSMRSRSKKQIHEDGGGVLLVDSVSVVPEKLEKVNVALQTPVTAAGESKVTRSNKQTDEDGSDAVPVPPTVAQSKNKFIRSKKKTYEDGCGALNADNVVLEKVDAEALTPISSTRRGKTKFTRSKKQTDKDGSSGHKVLARRFTRSALNIPKIDECNVSNRTPGKCVLRSTKSMVETLAAKHDGDECKVSNSTPGKRVLRSMRSTVETPAAKHNEEFKADDITPEKHLVRFTRLALKLPVEDSVSESTETDTFESSDFEESKSRHKPREKPKKKMELKMSKKIGLTKLPTNLRELFATGLLEGYPVTYNCNDKQHISLEGVIRGNVISCNCPSCKGSKTFSGYNWEVHAGSNKKHPLDFIFLENGKSLHDVLKACMSAPLNNLEATIQNVIGAPPQKRPSICQTCGVSFRSSHIREPVPSCDSCLKTEQLRPSNGIRSIGKSAMIGSLPDPCNSASLSSSAHNSGRITKKDLGLHKLVFMDDILPEGTEVAYYHHGKRLLDGYIKDSGICCLHCNVVVKPSVFEAHAGRAARKKPFHNIYLSNGVSLHELSVSLSKGRKLSAHENDDLCNICNDGGELLLCDVCPRAFHRGCLGLLEVPEGDWHCPPCQTMHQTERFVEYNDNAIAAGRVNGVDPIEQIIKRCIRIFTSPGTDEGFCVLCRLYDFSKGAFGDRTVLICDQCEKEYHVGCLREHNMCDLNALPEGDWFCCADCQRIYAALQELLLRGQEPLKDSDAYIIRKKQNKKYARKDGFDVSWGLLRGKTASAGSRLLISETVSLFSEAFDPIVGATGRDLIPSIVNGEDIGDQDFGGMYCVVLTSNSHIVSAGILRILGSELAELPLVATSREAQGQGYFQALFSCIERLLGSWNVKHFVLPAAEEALSIWTKKFGFTKIASDQLHEYAKGAHPMVFQGTSMLHKPVPRYRDSS